MLEVSGLNAGHGALTVLRDIDLNVQAGEVLLILGPNGVGKTTLLLTIAGFLRAKKGTVHLGDVDITGSSVSANARRGLRMVLEEHRVFPDLSVGDNLRLGQFGLRPTMQAATVEEVLKPFPDLRDRTEQLARGLSGGQQQMLALAQAFVSQPSVLLCDEPSRGLARALLPTVLSAIRQRADDGAAVIVVEQALDVAMSIADRVIVLERGSIALQGPASEMAADDKVRRVYLGFD